MIKKYVACLLCLLLIVSCSVFAFADDSDNSRDDSGYSTDTYAEDVQINVLRVSASSTSGLHSVLLGLIGDYNPISTDYTYTTTSYNGSIQTNHVVEITPDWSWIMTCFLFIVVIYSVFRLFGLALGGISR